MERNFRYGRLLARVTDLNLTNDDDYCDPPPFPTVQRAFYFLLLSAFSEKISLFVKAGLWLKKMHVKTNSKNR